MFTIPMLQEPFRTLDKRKQTAVFQNCSGGSQDPSDTLSVNHVGKGEYESREAKCVI